MSTGTTSDAVLGRWTADARDGHGGNIVLREMLDLDAAERHDKEAMLTRRFGLNRN